MNIWEKTAQLALLELSEREKTLIFPQVQNIVDFFHHISKVQTKNTEPLITPLDEPLLLRQDAEPQESPPSTQLLDQAPAKNAQMIQTPLIIDSDS